jgi:hypothetical protein
VFFHQASDKRLSLIRLQSDRHETHTIEKLLTGRVDWCIILVRAGSTMFLLAVSKFRVADLVLKAVTLEVKGESEGLPDPQKT